VFHAVACAILIDIRIMGVLVPLCTLGFSAFDFITKRRGHQDTRGYRSVFLYLLLLVLGVFLFWPLLWRNTLSNCAQIVRAFVRNDYYPFTNLYWGKPLTVQQQPWHYAPVWILISTPLLYSFCALVGLSVAVRTLFGKTVAHGGSKRNGLLFLVLLFLPMILAQGRLYDGWRHLYFIYPVFLIFSLSGLVGIQKAMHANLRKVGAGVADGLLVCVLSFSFADTAGFMMKYHPHENVYFNRLAGSSMQEIKRRFDLDYWGLSYRKALEYVLRNDPEDSIKVYFAHRPGLVNAWILPEQDRQRLHSCESSRNVKYFFGDYGWHPGDYPYPNEVYSIRIGNAKIMSVYRMQQRPDLISTARNSGN
jgi:hypothetical protein